MGVVPPAWVCAVGRFADAQDVVLVGRALPISHLDPREDRAAGANWWRSHVPLAALQQGMRRCTARLNKVTGVRLSTVWRCGQARNSVTGTCLQSPQAARAIVDRTLCEDGHQRCPQAPRVLSWVPWQQASFSSMPHTGTRAPAVIAALPTRLQGYHCCYATQRNGRLSTARRQVEV